nr:PREDICTED: LOW QUALITY PROTEIN: olfactory receptor 2F1-like [Lepisosteus oculatus]
MSRPNISLHSEFIIVGLPTLQEQKTALFIIFLILFLATFLGNLLIVVLISLDQRLHMPMYFFLWNLSLLDILMTTSIIPKMLAGFFGHRTISFSGCFGQMYFIISFTAVEGFLVAAMAYDRYVAVVKPLHYNSLINTKVCITMTTTAWVLGVLASLLIIASVVKLETVESRKKAFSMFSSHVTVVFLYYVSGAMVYIGLRVESIPPDGRIIIGAVHFFLTPLLNPIIYSLRNKKIKAAAQRLCRSRVQSASSGLVLARFPTNSCAASSQEEGRRDFCCCMLVRVSPRTSL